MGRLGLLSFLLCPMAIRLRADPFCRPGGGAATRRSHLRTRRKVNSMPLAAAAILFQPVGRSVSLVQSHSFARSVSPVSAATARQATRLPV